MTTQSDKKSERMRRKGAVVLLTTFLLIVMIGLVALAVDSGFMIVARSELQTAADSASLAAAAGMRSSMSKSQAELTNVAQTYASTHRAGGKRLAMNDTTVEFGTWDAIARTFTPSKDMGNAIRVTCRRQNVGTFFAPILGHKTFSVEASAIAMASPRDIASVVDLTSPRVRLVK